MDLFEKTFIKHRNLTIQNQLNEIFVIQHRKVLKDALIEFLEQQFEVGNIQSVHAGLSTTEYKPNDWKEPMADAIINHMIKYFETIRSQTEKDMHSRVPLEQD